MATDKGVIQGYTGVEAVDAKHQIIVVAQAHCIGSEQELLLPKEEALATRRTSATVLTADAGYHREANFARSRRWTCRRGLPTRTCGNATSGSRIASTTPRR